MTKLLPMCPDESVTDVPGPYREAPNNALEPTGESRGLAPLVCGRNPLAQRWAFGLLWLQMNVALRVLGCIGLGAVFWVPSIVVHLISGTNFSGQRVWVVTMLSVLASIFSFRVLNRLFAAPAYRAAALLSLLVGIWLLGPLATMLSASFSGGGFSRPGALEAVLSQTVHFVPGAFVAATYDGTLGALAAVTVWFLAAALRNAYVALRQA